MTAGTIAGALAGYFGGIADAALMSASEVFLSLPWLFFLFGLRAFLPLDMEALTAFLAIIIAIGIVGWPRPARLVRNVVLSAKEREYVLVARGFGAGHLYLLLKHILPATLSVVLTHAALLVPRYILAEITLTFFGLGLNEPAASWGQMFALLLQYFRLVPVSAWMYVPLVCLVITCFSYISLSEFTRTRFTKR
jgi:peptide/nickel transport system permease protein